LSPGPVVTIDGPAGVGKSTVGRRVAAGLRLPFIDTGIFYRVLTVVASEAGLAVGDAAQLARLADGFEVELNTDPLASPESWQARLGMRTLNLELWDPRLASLLAFVARQREVRQALMAGQRLAASPGAVAVGRDTGTAVFPKADCKIYLDAPTEVRLERRRRELERRGLGIPDEMLREDVVGRDHQDLSRENNPLAVPDGALVISTAGISADQVVELVFAHCRAQGIG
jgi:cytidylate kinase